MLTLLATDSARALMWIDRASLAQWGTSPPGIDPPDQYHPVTLGDDIHRVGGGHIPIGLDPLGEDLVYTEILGVEVEVTCDRETTAHRPRLEV